MMHDPLMIVIVMPETCWAYKKYNKIISDIHLAFILQFYRFILVNERRYELTQIKKNSSALTCFVLFPAATL